MQILGSFPAFCGTRRFITAFTRALDLYLAKVQEHQVGLTLSGTYRLLACSNDANLLRHNKNIMEIL
jgi:hypothetical protein